MGPFVADGLLATTIEGIPLHEKRVPLEEALWAGTVELRIMELLEGTSPGWNESTS